MQAGKNSVENNALLSHELVDKNRSVLKNNQKYRHEIELKEPTFNPRGSVGAADGSGARKPVKKPEPNSADNINSNLTVNQNQQNKLNEGKINNQQGNQSSNFSELVQNEKIINPATNKVVTEHIIVSSGKAPKTTTPNSIYEVSRADGSKSITYYDDQGRIFSREDYGQQRTHGSLGYDDNGKVPAHEHKITYKTYNGKEYKDKSYYRVIDENGKAIGPWILDQ
ncbi:hypothetical protein PT276_05665 [Orbaceae bacterium ESL0721]|nr:hypothetical protein [Orbaceae bacterium ESL0721]